MDDQHKHTDETEPIEPAARTVEDERLARSARREENWQRWGTYLPERQWGVVREDYSADGNVWTSFTHDMARYRAFRWGEDGLLGWTDRECRLCFSTSLWNGNDPILKERLFGLTGPEGNHGEDVKEQFYYLDATPTGSYAKALYKYPQRAFPYDDLLAENARRGFDQPEYELLDTGIFDESRYFDVQVEYAKAAEEDMLLRLTLSNRGPDAAELSVLPTLTLRNNWSWRTLEAAEETRPWMKRSEDDEFTVIANHRTLGQYRYTVIAEEAGTHADELLFTENDTNIQRLDNTYTGAQGFSKDAFDRYLVHGEKNAVNPAAEGTKCAFVVRLKLAAGASATVRLRLVREDMGTPAAMDTAAFEATFADRLAEADAFYAARIPPTFTDDERNVSRQAYAGLLWTKQFYYYVSERWLSGDPAQPAPPEERLKGRNTDWKHLFCRDVLSMPDKWEYPWFAAWDTAFHMIPMAEIDPQFAKDQLLLLLREWYLHPNGQMPAYEFSFSDVNPPVHAWAVVHVYEITGRKSGVKDVDFLERCFQKLLLNFTWWVNRYDENGHNLFGGGFLGLDNIGIFDRSTTLPDDVCLNQADGTAWMGLFCSAMLTIAVELAQTRPAYEDIASKFFEHYIFIIDAINGLGGTGLWDDVDGFYYDQLSAANGPPVTLKVRSIVGVVPLYAIGVLRQGDIDRLPGFRKRMEWFLKNKPELARHVARAETDDPEFHDARFIGLVPKERLLRILARVLDETEFLSEHGIRALSKIHEAHPYEVRLRDHDFRVAYVPGEGDSGMFGGNSNWRGPVWFPVNILLVNALERYHAVYGDSLKVECPTGSGNRMTLLEVAKQIAARLEGLFLRDANGRRPSHGEEPRYINDPHWKDLVLFSEYFHGDSGRGLGASHQTGWTALAATCMLTSHRHRAEGTVLAEGAIL